MKCETESKPKPKPKPKPKLITITVEGPIGSGVNLMVECIANHIGNYLSNTKAWDLASSKIPLSIYYNPANLLFINCGSPVKVEVVAKRPKV